MSERLFVYGTLKRGLSRHAALAGQRFLGTARTQPHYRLLVVADFPGLVRVPVHTGRSIRGEVWEVSDACLRRLDEIESVADALFYRAPVELLPPFDGQSVLAYLYAASTRRLPEFPGDEWPYRSGHAGGD